MTEQELREKIFGLVWTPPLSCRNKESGAVNYHLLADQILALVKAAGYKSPEEVKEIERAGYFKGYDHCAKVREDIGYVQLAEDQSLPISLKTSVYKRLNYHSRDQKIMVKLGWRKVILEEKDGKD